MKLKILMLLHCLLWVAPFAYAKVQPISHVAITSSSFIFNQITNTSDATVTIKNTGSIDLTTPFHLVLDTLKPQSVSLYNSYGESLQGNPYVEVPLTNYVLLPGASVKVPVKFVNLGKSVISAAFSVEAQPFAAENIKMLQVTAKFFPEAGGKAVGAGFNIYVDGNLRGKTDALGKALLKVPVDAQKIEVGQPPDSWGVTSRNGDSAVIVEVDDGKEVSGDSVMRVDLLQNNMFPINAPQVTVRFFKNEKPIPINYIAGVELRDPEGGETKSIEDMFSIKPDGTLVANQAKFLEAIGNIDGEKIISAYVIDKYEMNYEQEIHFYISQFKIQGKLVAPPSQPNLNVSGIPIQVSVDGTAIKFTTESLADGSFPLPLLPVGKILFKAVTQQNTIQYTGAGPVTLSGDTSINVNMLAPIDVANNVPAITIQNP